VIIVSDTSPLRALQCLERVELLRALFQNVVIPPAVMAELTAKTPRVPEFHVDRFPFITVKTPTRHEVLPESARDLGLGEREAIELAIELRPATLLVDDAEARDVAGKCGVETMGVLGVLLKAKQRGLVPALAPLVDELRTKIAFRVSSAVVAKLLRDAGE
jgi:uncharacterized protein